MRGKLLIAATVVAFLLAVVFLVSRESRWDPRYTPIDLGSGPSLPPNHQYFYALVLFENKKLMHSFSIKTKVGKK